MFYFQTIVLLSVIYWISALVAESVLASLHERRLPVVARVGVGYVVSIIWFAAAFKFMPIGWAWIVGVGLLICYGGCRLKLHWRRQLSMKISTLKTYLPAFLGVLVLGNVLLVPLHLSNNYGPFTEGGGDISIYADSAKYLTDNHLPAFGIRSVPHDLTKTVQNPYEKRGGLPAYMSAFDERHGNPPWANYQSYRLVYAKMFSSSLYGPLAQWSLILDKMNYAAFYASQAFQYACLLLLVWALFAPCGRPFGLMALFLVASSHGVSSVYYNLYFLHGLCLMISCLSVYLAFAGGLSSTVPRRVCFLCLM